MAKSSFRQDLFKKKSGHLCKLLFKISFEDSDSSEDEGMPDYKIGGYHPVPVGEVFIN